MSYSDIEDDILPEADIFSNRAVSVMRAKEELLKKSIQQFGEDLHNQNEDNVDSSMTDFPECHSEPGKGRGRKGRGRSGLGKRGLSKRGLSTRGLGRKRAASEEPSVNCEDKTDEPLIVLSADAERRLADLKRKHQADKNRVRKETSEILAMCNQKSDSDTDLDDRYESEIVLNVTCIMKTGRVTVGEKEKFSSIISKISDLFKLNPAETLFCWNTRNIESNDTPLSLKLKHFDMIECIPYKPEILDDLLLKFQSNDSRKKVEVHTNIVKKFSDIKKKYAEKRGLCVEDVVLYFDGERIEDHETPKDLDIEQGCIIDAKILSYTPKHTSTPSVIPTRPVPPDQMLNVVVLD